MAQFNPNITPNTSTGAMSLDDISAPSSFTDVFSPSSSVSTDAGVSHPLNMDYIKVRAYLYKFTPDVIPAGASAQIIPVDTPSTQAAKDAINKSQSVRVVLQNAQAYLSALQGLMSAAQTNPSVFAASSIPRNAASALSALNELPTIKAGTLILGSASHNSTINFPSGDLQGTPNLLPSSVVKPAGVGGLKADSMTASDAVVILISYLNDFSAVNDPLFTNSMISMLLQFCGNAISFIDTNYNEAVLTANLKAQAVSGKTSAIKNFEVNRFVYDLKAADLSRFDISRFISAYQVDQRLGNIAAVGTISATATFQNLIVSINDLQATPGINSVRRPIFFPTDAGFYLTPTIVTSTIDPISREPVSTPSGNDLIYRIAQAQSLEDEGGVDPSGTSSGPTTTFEQDITTIEIGIRLRGIKDPTKKKAILFFFETGLADPRLEALAAQNFKSVEGADTVGVSISSTSFGLNPSLGDPTKQLIQLKLFTNPADDGILLSDLIQKFDFISLFIYKQPVAPEFIENSIIANSNDPYFFDKESLFLNTPASFITGIPNDTRRFALYSSEFNGFVADTSSSQTPPNVNTITLSAVGSMGLFGATKRVYNSTIFQGSVFDAAELMDSSLFNLYQNLYADKNPLQILAILLDSLYLIRTSIPKSKPSPTQDDLNQIAQTTIAQAAVSGIPAGSTIVQNLIKTRQDQAKLRALQSSSQGQTIYDNGILFEGKTIKVTSSFIDILSLRAFNQFDEVDPVSGLYKGPRHIFNIPAFLYANVMRMRKFNVRVVSESEAVNISNGALPFNFVAGAGAQGALDPFALDGTSKGGVLTKFKKEVDGSGGSVLEINPLLDVNNPNNPFASQYKSYFLFLNDSLGNFVADLKTPYEVMNDVASSCFLELYETPGGRFVFRTPQYNNNVPIFTGQFSSGESLIAATPSLNTRPDGTLSIKSTVQSADSSAQMVTSRDIIPISTRYSQTVKNLVSKQGLGYGVDLIGLPTELLQYFYSNGKLISQYGLNLSNTGINPNVRFTPKASPLAFSDGMFHYCRFFLEYSNMDKLTGDIVAVGDPAIQIGRTYFDVENQKFGYIFHVIKACTVGETYTTQFSVNAVRDAVMGQVVGNEIPPRPIFRRLPEMEDFISKFTVGSSRVSTINAGQESIPQPISKLTTLTNNYTINFFPPPVGMGGAAITPTITKQ